MEVPTFKRGSAVGEDGFAACGGEGVDGGEAGELGGALVGMVGEEEDAVRAGPLG